MVSIVVVSYNSEETILETLESIEKQTYKNYEVIITDDASSDDTIKICQIWKEKNKEKKIKILSSKENQGVTKNINKGIKASNGNWIKCIAADDILLDNCLESNIEYFKENKEAKVCFSRAQEFSSKGLGDISPKEKIGLKLGKLTAKEQFNELCYGNFITAPTVFFKRELLEKYNFFDENIPAMEDFPFWLKITKSGEKIYYFNKITVKYRKGESLSLSNEKIANLRFFETQKLVYKYYLKDSIGIFFKWHFILELFVLEKMIKLFNNKRNKVSDFIIRYKQIVDPVFLIRKIKRDILWNKF